MNEMLRKTREWLNCSTRRSFSAVIHEAKITPRQMQVCELKFVRFDQLPDSSRAECI